MRKATMSVGVCQGQDVNGALRNLHEFPSVSFYDSRRMNDSLLCMESADAR
jgi:hypothetical protein